MNKKYLEILQPKLYPLKSEQKKQHRNEQNT